MTPKKNLILSAIVLVLAPFCTTQAQILSAGTTASADTDVLNTGTTVLAWSANGLATTPVHGVTFSGDTTQNGVTFSIVGPTLGYPGAGVGSGLSADYTAVLYNIIYNFDTSFQLQLTHLTPNKTYIAQIFGGDSGTSKPGAESITDNTNGTNATSNLVIPTTGTQAAFLFDKFTANSSGTETITLASNGDSGSFPVFDAINLQVAPEPSTWALIASGLIALVCVGRSRFKADAWSF